MDYNDIDDVELITLLEENDENVRNIIYDKYSYLVDILIKKYQRAMMYRKEISLKYHSQHMIIRQ